MLLYYRFVINLPGPDFVKGFLKRHKNLTVRQVNLIKRGRAAVSHEIVNAFFDNFYKMAAGVPPENIHNYDETNLKENPGGKKGIVKRGSKYPEEVGDYSKSAVFCYVLRVCSWGVPPPLSGLQGSQPLPVLDGRGTKGSEI
jgi:hypothetical protein